MTLKQSVAVILLYWDSVPDEQNPAAVPGGRNSNSQLSAILSRYQPNLFTALSFCIDKQPPNQRNPKPNKDNTIQPVNIMNIVRRKTVADLTSQHYFSYIGGEYKQQADGKDDNPFLYGMIDKCGGSGDPENKNGRVQCIHKKAGQKYFGHISFTKPQHDLLALFVDLYFFEKQKINSHYDQENTAGNTDLRTMGADTAKQFGKYIADQNKGNITGRYT